MFVGQEKILDEFIIPNIGLDLPIYFEGELVSTARINKVLMQRYQNIPLCQEAGVIGILVGTVVVPHCNSIIQSLKKCITARGKKCYEALVGKINEPKLRNLQAIDLWIYVGCRETSIYSRKEFMIPLVTPHELFMALEPERFPWSMKIITDLSELSLLVDKQTNTAEQSTLKLQ